MRTHYDILKVQENCSQDEIKQQYRKLAKKYHPDRNPSAKAHEQFIAIKKAYNTLSDEKRRAHYDRGLKYIRTKKANGSFGFEQFQKNKANPQQRYKTEAERNRNYELNRQRAWMKHIRRRQEDKAYFKKFKTYALIVSLGSLLLAISFFVDYAMTRTGPVEVVMEKFYLFPVSQDPADREYFTIITDKEEHRIFYELVDEIQRGDQISLKQSPVYGMTLGIDIIRENQLIRTKNPAVEAGFKFFSLLFGVALLTFFFKDRNEWAVNLTLINLLLLAINALMLTLRLMN